MKKLKTGFIALALMAGVTFAFASSKTHMPKKNDPTYNWTHFDRNGIAIGTLENATVEQAVEDLGCDGSVSIKCATAPGAPELFYN